MQPPKATLHEMEQDIDTCLSRMRARAGRYGFGQRRSGLDGPAHWGLSLLSGLWHASL
jgi:hypothetical protein